jgi:hypothetical protein
MKTNNKIRCEEMKKVLKSIVIVVLSLGWIEQASAQATTTQNLTFAVNAVYKIATSGNPGPLTITSGTAGTDALTSATDNSTTYSITQNFGNTVKITAYLDAAMPAGYTLSLTLASTKGTSIPNVDISNALSGSAANMVTAIQIGADVNQVISYTFSALASAGTLGSTSRTITLTITN